MASEKRERQRQNKALGSTEERLPQPHSVGGTYATYDSLKSLSWIIPAAWGALLVKNGLRSDGAEIDNHAIRFFANHISSVSWGAIVALGTSIPAGRMLERFQSFNSDRGRLRTGLLVTGAIAGAAVGAVVESSAGSNFLLEHGHYSYATADVLDIAGMAIGGALGSFSQGVYREPTAS